MGKIVESGSNGGVVAVLLKVKKSLTWVNRLCAEELLSDMLRFQKKELSLNGDVS